MALLVVRAGTAANAPAAQDTWTGVDRVIAVGDAHGDYERFTAVLKSAGLIDADANWTGGNTHLVQCGDLLDRGAEPRKLMDLLIKLEQQAQQAGGYVHALIGNHEAMNLAGDWRYVSPSDYMSFQTPDSQKVHDTALKEFLAQSGGAVDDAARKKWEVEHPLGFFERKAMFGPDGIYGKWIRGHSAVIKIDDTLFLHGGISQKFANSSPKAINERVHDEFNGNKKLDGGIVTDQDGPLWYRGLASGDENQLDGLVKNILKHYGVSRIVIGHTFTDGAVTPRFGGRVILIDVGLARLYDSLGRQACLLIEKGQPYALHRGTKLELPKDSTVDMLRYLKEAAALDPAPSSLSKRIAALESKGN